MRIFAGLIGFLCGLLFFVKPIFSDTAENHAYRKTVLTESITINNRQIPFTMSSLFVLPGEEVFIDYAPDVISDIHVTEGRVSIVTNSRRHWTAPKSPDTHPVLILEQEEGAVAVQINVFVMTPMADMVGGRIGEYQIPSFVLWQ